MDNFVYHHPVKILFGSGCVNAVGIEAAALGSRLLVVYGQSSARENGLLGTILDLLRENNLETIELPGIPPNPLLSHVREGIVKVRENDCDMVLAVGGGSVIDAAKAIAAGVEVGHDVWKFFSGKKSIKTRLPVMTVPTAAGSGSEINHGIVLTNENNHFKFGFAHRLLIPDVCIADPSLTFSVPAAQTSAGGVDILSHCLEPYLSTGSAGIELQLGFLETIGGTLLKTIPACIEHPHSYEHRSMMLWCAMSAMSGYGAAGLGRVQFSLHCLGHGISALTGIAHGHGLSSLLPGWLDFHKLEFGDRLARWGEQVMHVKAGNSAEASEATVHAFRTFLQTIDCPARLRDAGCSYEDIDFLAAHAAAQARVWRLKRLTEDYCRAVLQHCW